MFSFLPDWAPNLHPLFVHFPIALLFVAVFVDAIGLFLREKLFWRHAALLLYGLGGLAVVATYFAGRQAAELIFLSAEANPLLTEHADLGQWTFWFFGIYAIVRPIVDVTALGKKFAVRIGGFVIAFGGLFLLYSTAEHGAELVFKYGAGVDAVDHTVQGVTAPQDSSAAALSAPLLAEDGSWTWKPTRASTWKSSMTFPEGGGDFSRTTMMDGGERGDVLALFTEGETAMFVVDQPLGDIQMDMDLNLDDFDGVVMIIHHVKDLTNYHFTSIGNGEMRLGRSENGDLYTLDTKPYEPSGWVSFRVVSDGTHVRSYADEALVAHGHGSEPENGSVGLRVNGIGTVLVDFLSVQVLHGASETLPPTE